MTWEIISSVLIANTVFIAAVAAIGVSVFSLFTRRMKAQIEAGEMPTCPMPNRAHQSNIESAIEA
jgi:hypothetical protein